MRPISQILRDIWRDGDLLLLLLCVSANVFGLVLIFSATRYTHSLQNDLLKQAVASIIGIGAYVLFTFLDMEALVERFRAFLFALSILLLLLLIPFGNDDGTGNQSWINIPGSPFHLQPAELVKLSFVLLLSLQFCHLQKKGSVNRPSAIIQTAGHTMLLCALLFFVSSDMGMVLVYLFIFLILAWTAGVRLFWFILGLATTSVAGWLLWPHLPAYIQMRFLVVFDHSLDPQGKGFQQLRSLLAIGSGRVTGQGYLHGIQTQNVGASALPARHTDFIFSVAGEEFGLLGTLLILILLSAIVLRCIWIAHTAQTSFHTYVAIGYGGMLAVQTILNVGMCLYMTPVVGLTLPFFSYGGSSLIALYIAMGILSDMKMRSRPAWLRGLANKTRRSTS
ncbi:MAG: Cell division protein FtsW [Evtepia sp.]|jgi:rod shape determining protein RodA|nr:Cell division protein FtsW [Evtepia sp.]